MVKVCSFFLRNIFFIVCALPAIGQGIELSQYLENNKMIFDFQNDSLKKDLSNFDCVFVGEFHGRKINNDAFIDLIKFLYYNNGIRNIFVEEGISRGLMMNHYLETGSQKTLNLLTICNNGEKQYLIGLKHLYDSLPKDEKFHIYGIDYEQNAECLITISALALLIPNIEAPPYSISKIVDRISNVDDNYTYKEYLMLRDSIVGNFNSNKNIYQRFLGEKYSLFEKIIRAIAESAEFQGGHYEHFIDSLKISRREEYIYRNINEILDCSPQKKFIARFGLAHIGLKSMVDRPGMESIVSKILKNKYHGAYEKVCTIGIFNNDFIVRHFYNKIYECPPTYR